MRVAELLQCAVATSQALGEPLAAPQRAVMHLVEMAKLVAERALGIWISMTAGIKKPACGRLLGDCLSLFLTNLSSLQIAQPTSRLAE